MANENEPIIPPAGLEIVKKSWTSSHLEAAMNQQQTPAPAPVQSTPAPAPTPSPPAED